MTDDVTVDSTLVERTLPKHSKKKISEARFDYFESKVVLVRLKDNREIVGIFWASSMENLWDQIDEVTDPGACEFKRLQYGGITWPSSGAKVVPRIYKGGDAEDEGNEDFFPADIMTTGRLSDDMILFGDDSEEETKKDDKKWFPCPHVDEEGSVWFEEERNEREKTKII